MSQNELSPINNWVSEGDAGNVLHHPISGEPFDPAMPPAFLLADARLKQGYEYIRYKAPDITLGMYYTSGEAWASDLGGDQFEGILEHPDNDVHAVGHTIAGTQRDYAGRLHLPRSVINGYRERIDAVTNRLAIASFCVGLEVDIDGRPAGRAENDLQRISDVIRLQPHDENFRGSGRVITKLIMANEVQWYHALRFGEQLSLVHDEAERRSSEMENVLLLTPIADADMTRKLITLGFPGEPEDMEQVADFDTYTDDVAWDAGAMSLGYIPYGTLR